MGSLNHVPKLTFCQAVGAPEFTEAVIQARPCQPN